MKPLYVVTYNGRYGNGNDTSIECITDDFGKWFKEHNANRVKGGNDPESEEEFDVEEFEPVIYNTE